MFALIFLGLIACASGANILALFPVPSYSHQIVYRVLTMELNRRGHNLTVITPDPINNPNLTNYHEIDISFYYPYWNRRFDMASDAAHLLRLFPELFLVAFSDSMHEMCEMYLSEPNVNRLIRDNQKFDLFITEFGVSACFYAFSKLSDYKFIGIFSFSHTVIVHSDIGNPASASYLPDPFLPFLDRMSFWERFRTFIFQIASWVNYVYVIWDHTQIARKYFGEDTPYLHHFERNVSVVMTNTHFTTTFPRPLVPNFVDIGGSPFHFHRRVPEPLPKLSKRGHEKVIVTPNPLGGEHENYTEISTHDLSCSAWCQTFEFSSQKMCSPELLILSFYQFFVDLVDKELSYERVKVLTNSTDCDLVFT